MANPNMIKGMPSVNKMGRKPSVFQSFTVRAGYFLEKYSRSQLIDISNDEAQLDKYSAFDAMILMQLGNSLKRVDGKVDLTVERERLYDRTIGKAAQNVAVNHSGAVAVFSADISPITDFLGEFIVREESSQIPTDVRSGSLLPTPIRTE